MKIRYKGEYYITTAEVSRENGEYSCKAWKYRTGKEVTDVKALRGIAESIRYRRRKGWKTKMQKLMPGNRN